MHAGLWLNEQTPIDWQWMRSMFTEWVSRTKWESRKQVFLWHRWLTSSSSPHTDCRGTSHFITRWLNIQASRWVATLVSSPVGDFSLLTPYPCLSLDPTHSMHWLEPEFTTFEPFCICRRQFCQITTIHTKTTLFQLNLVPQFNGFCETAFPI